MTVIDFVFGNLEEKLERRHGGLVTLRSESSLSDLEERTFGS